MRQATPPHRRRLVPALAGTAAALLLCLAWLALAPRPLREDGGKHEGSPPERDLRSHVVGRWVVVRYSPDVLTPDVEMLHEYSVDGRFTFRILAADRGEQVRTGTYRIEGSKMHLQSLQSNGKDETRAWYVTLSAPNDNELAMEHLNDDSGERTSAVLRREP